MKIYGDLQWDALESARNREIFTIFVCQIDEDSYTSGAPERIGKSLCITSIPFGLVILMTTYEYS